MTAALPRPEPFRIEPVFSERIWGSRSLAPLFPEKTNLASPIGEAWLTSVDCRIATGPFAGKTLGEAWTEMPREWRGTRLVSTENFPLLVKFIFPTDKLSIQVHPDDAYASVHEKAAGGRGKTEMWHIVSAEPGATLLAGLKPGVTKEQFSNALANHTLEELFQRHPVHPGDTFFIPAGMPHTIGAGMVVFEVQEYSDLTYRVYDYGRVDSHGKPRELHVQKAMEVMNFGAFAGGRVARISVASRQSSHSLLAACRYFATETWMVESKQEFPWSDDRFTLLIVMEGKGSFASEFFGAPYCRGECWFVPASRDKLSVHPSAPSNFARAYIPDVSALREGLRHNGVPEGAIAAAVFD